MIAAGTDWGADCGVDGGADEAFHLMRCRV